MVTTSLLLILGRFPPISMMGLTDHLCYQSLYLSAQGLLFGLSWLVVLGAMPGLLTDEPNDHRLNSK